MRASSGQSKGYGTGDLDWFNLWVVLYLPIVNVHATSPTVPDRNLIAHKRCFKCCPCVLDKF